MNGIYRPLHNPATKILFFFRNIKILEQKKWLQNSFPFRSAPSRALLSYIPMFRMHMVTPAPVGQRAYLKAKIEKVGSNLLPTFVLGIFGVSLFRYLGIPASLIPEIPNFRLPVYFTSSKSTSVTSSLPSLCEPDCAPPLKPWPPVKSCALPAFCAPAALYISADAAWKADVSSFT